MRLHKNMITEETEKHSMPYVILNFESTGPSFLLEDETQSFPAENFSS